MKTKKLHRWNLSCRQARELQDVLAKKVRIRPMRKEPRLIAGVDCAFSRDGQRVVACVVVLKISDFEIVEQKIAVRKVTMAYVPGLLSFREAPVCIAAAAKLESRPDVFMIDGQGIAHPRRLGLASHLGLFFDKPTIGCAKSRLFGQYNPPAAQKGRYSLLKDKDETIGAVVRTRTNVKPVFVSAGHKCSLEDAIRITLACAVKYRLPEPTRLGHQLVSRLKLKV